MSPAVPVAASFDRVYVGRLPPGTTELGLREAFGAVGVQVRDIDMVLNRTTGVSRGFAFVRLRERIDPDVDAVSLAQLRRASLDGCPFDIRAVRGSGSYAPTSRAV
jgi:hypothetical protein